MFYSLPLLHFLVEESVDRTNRSRVSIVAAAASMMFLPEFIVRRSPSFISFFKIFESTHPVWFRCRQRLHCSYVLPSLPSQWSKEVRDTARNP